MLITFGAFLFLILIVVFVHEAGHFVVAKLCGMKVPVFSVGMGRRLFGVKIGETDYRISLLPVGGFVQIEGQDFKGVISDEKGAYCNKPRWQRALVLFAGPFASLLLGFFISFVVFMARDNSATVLQRIPPVVGEVEEGSPAQVAGILPGDVLVSVNGKQATSWRDALVETSVSPDRKISVVYRRGGVETTVSLTPRPAGKYGSGEVGLSPRIPDKPMVERLSLQRAADESFAYNTRIAKENVKFIPRVATGEIKAKQGLAGPVEIATISGEIARMGILSLLEFVGFISVALGVMNLMPVPVLDGGQMLILGIEGIRRKDFSSRTKNILLRIGWCALLALIVLTLTNDLLRNIPIWFSK